jgi:flagellar basal-body rod modification protein FlgD
MSNTIDGTSGASGTSGTTGADSGAAAAAKSKTIDKNMFLQLLVAQLRHQDPMNPSDGTQFVAQLAQFQQLESSVNTAQDVAAIRQDLDVLAKAGAGTTNSSSGSAPQS